MIALWSRIKAGVISALVFLTAVIVIWWSGRKQGKQAQRSEQTEATLHKQTEADEKMGTVQNETNKLPDGAASKRLKSNWVRREKD